MKYRQVVAYKTYFDDFLRIKMRKFRRKSLRYLILWSK